MLVQLLPRVSFLIHMYKRRNVYLFPRRVCCCCCCLASVRSRSAAFTLDFCLYNGGTTTRKVQEPSRFRRTLMLMMRIQPTDFSRSLGGPPFSTWLVCVLDSYDDYYSLNNREIKNRLVFWRCLDMCSMFLVILLERQGCLSPFKCLMFSCRDSAVHKKKQLRDDVVLCLRTYR